MRKSNWELGEDEVGVSCVGQVGWQLSGGAEHLGARVPLLPKFVGGGRCWSSGCPFDGFGACIM